ncbi:hypothetical protein A3J41_01375 [candidate division TM6 bacterium RIFCSPHIGHO2_12_FULL_38_8]|nr:MAG: hypothetical protein A3J41_01375 [candidate division TM6 bacterium RIFCSPHIGHO2_12_FULL_38_8]
MEHDDLAKKMIKPLFLALSLWQTEVMDFNFYGGFYEKYDQIYHTFNGTNNDSKPQFYATNSKYHISDGCCNVSKS